MSVVEFMEIMKKMKEFDESYENSFMLMVFRYYMGMVLEMLMFIRVVRIVNWEFYFEVFEIFIKYFFVYDYLNYARIIFFYLVKMKVLLNIDFEIYVEFKDGKWLVNKNFCVRFYTRLVLIMFWNI